MRISCLPVSLFGDIVSGKMELVDFAKQAKDIGYDCIDISSMFIKNRTPTYLAPLKAALKEVGLPLFMMSAYPDFTHPDPVQRQREFDYLVADIALASELDIEHVRILAGQSHEETSRIDGIDYVVKAFHDIAPYGRKYGVSLLYEDHAKPGAWFSVDFSFPPDIFLEIFKQTEDTDIGLNFDTGNITAYGADPMDILPQVFHRTRAIHITDMSERGKFSPTNIGEGVVPNREVFKYLKSHGYKGSLSIEEASGRGMLGIKEAYAFVRKAWDEA